MTELADLKLPAPPHAPKTAAFHHRPADPSPRRGRKRQRSPSSSSSPHHHHPSLPSGESTCFRGRRRNRSTSPFLPGSVAVSRNTSAGFRSRSCSPRVRYFMTAFSGSGSGSGPGSASIPTTATLRWKGDRRRSQSPSRSPRAWRDGGGGGGDLGGWGEGSKRRRHRTRSRSRGRMWGGSLREGGPGGVSSARAYEEAAAAGLRRSGVSLSSLRMEVRCDEYVVDEGVGGCDE